MVARTHKISVFSDGNLLTSETKYNGWYCLHASEGGYVNPVGLPAIRPSLDAYPPVNMTKEIQWMSYNLNEGRITKAKWRALYGSTVALTNGQSWYQKVCRDYVNGLDLNALDEFGNPSLPKLMKGLIFGGMFIRGESQYSLTQAIKNIVTMTRVKSFSAFRKSFISALTLPNVLLVTPGIGAIDAHQPIPSIATIKEKNWYMQCVTSGDRIWNILGSTIPLLAPYILNVPSRYPLEWFKPWNRNYLPNPLTTNP